jgi:hypothetical protein
METPFKRTQDRINYVFKTSPCLPDPVKLDNASVHSASDVTYLGLLLDPKLLYTKHLRTVSNKATGTFCNIFPLLNQNSTLSQTSTLTLYKLLIRSLLTHAAPVCNTTCNSNYLKLQVVQNTSLRIIGDYPRGTPISPLHDSLNIESLKDFIHHLTAKFFY